MGRRDDTKQVNVNMTEEEKKELEDFCRDNGLSINAAMNRAREMLLVDSLKVKAPDLAANVEEFECFIEKILVAYKGAVERSLSADERAKMEVKAQLDGISVVAQNNKELQQKLEDTINQNVTLKKELEQALGKIDDLEIELQKIEKNNADILILKEEKLALSQKIADLEKKHAEDVKKLQDENFEKILQLVQAK